MVDQVLSSLLLDYDCGYECDFGYDWDYDSETCSSTSKGSVLDSCF
jgi:hypothetical protein